MNQDTRPDSLSAISKLARSPNLADRLRACKLIQHSGGRGKESREMFAIARSLIPDCDNDDYDNDVRWQAIIAVGEYIKTYPEGVWSVIEEYGVSSDKDMRTGISVCLLEHLLDFDFAYFERVKKLIRHDGISGKRMKHALGLATVMSDDKLAKVTTYLEGLEDV